jgi:putative MATE family efflux protein
MEKLSKTESKEFNKRLFSMVFPIAFQSFMTAAVSASDAIMVGFLEQKALSAVSLAGQVTFVLNLFITVLVQGTTMLAAQYWGKGERDKVERIMGISLRYTFLITAIFCLASVIFPSQLMKIFTNEPGLISRGASYLQIAGLSYIPSGISQIYLCIMKNSEKTAKSTVIGSSSMILNIILNTVLIFGLAGFPALGIRGAAIATTAATTIQLIWTLAESAKKDSLKIRIAYIIHCDKSLQKDFNHYTLPIVGNYFFWGGGVTIFAAIIGHMGNDAVAAYSIANIVKNLITCVTKGIGTAGAILVGNELGRNSFGTAKLYANRSAVLSALLGAASGAVILLLRPLIISFAALPAIPSGYLSGMLAVCSYFVIAQAINNTVIGGIFCAGGRSQFGCICDAIVLWVIVTPVAALSAFVWKLPVLAVYCIISMDEIIKVPFVLLYYRKYKWVQNITRA